jgi:glycosyltransferase involved in cell wall biosynthesis
LIYCRRVGETSHVTVVVPTRDRPLSLARCLAALEAQRHSLASIEIVVVDDGSADARSVEQTVAASPSARLLRLDGVGPAAARNRGARSARGSLVLFTDDDCEPAPDWLARLTSALGGRVDAAAGRTLNGLPGNPLAEASQVIANYLVERSLEPSGRATFATSNNLACTIEAFAAVSFDERYPGAGGEDRDWCARLAANGLALVVEPAAIVVHRHELHAGAFWRQHFAYGRGARRYRRDHPAEGRVSSPRFYSGLVRAGFDRGPTVGSLVAVAQAAAAAGFLSEAVAERNRDQVVPRQA